MKNSNQLTNLEIVIAGQIDDIKIEKKFDSKMANIRCRFIDLLLLKNQNNQIVSDSYLKSIWKIAESGLSIEKGEKLVLSYQDFVLNEMLNKVSGGWQ
jgi:hypothetical protein